MPIRPHPLSNRFVIENRGVPRRCGARTVCDSVDLFPRQRNPDRSMEQPLGVAVMVGKCRPSVGPAQLLGCVTLKPLVEGAAVLLS